MLAPLQSVLPPLLPLQSVLPLRSVLLLQMILHFVHSLVAIKVAPRSPGATGMGAEAATDIAMDRLLVSVTIGLAAEGLGTNGGQGATGPAAVDGLIVVVGDLVAGLVGDGDYHIAGVRDIGEFWTSEGGVHGHRVWSLHGKGGVEDGRGINSDGMVDPKHVLGEQIRAIIDIEVERVVRLNDGD